MKKLIFILTLMLFGLIGYGQTVHTITDNIEGVTAFNQSISCSGQYQALSIDILCTEIGGTSEGTLVLQGGNTTSTYSTLSTNDFGDEISYLTNDTLTVTDGAAWKIIINNPSFRYYNIKGAGGSGDTTQVSIKYVFYDN